MTMTRACDGGSTLTAHERFVGKDQRDIFATARAFGIGAVIDPSVDQNRWTTAEGGAGVAADLNAAATVAAGYGLTVGYHNHAFELETVIDGLPALELLAAQLDDGVFLELDHVMNGQVAELVLAQAVAHVEAVLLVDLEIAPDVFASGISHTS